MLSILYSLHALRKTVYPSHPVLVVSLESRLAAFRASYVLFHYLIERIYQAWNSDKVATMLLLDVSGTYDKVSHRRLLHNLSKRSVDQTIIRWVGSFLSDRTTMLKTSEYTTPKTQIVTGIPQSSPLSPILYLFYNSDLIDGCNARTDLDTMATGFVDEVGLLTIGNSTEDNCRSL